MSQVSIVIGFLQVGFLDSPAVLLPFRKPALHLSWPFNWCCAFSLRELFIAPLESLPILFALLPENQHSCHLQEHQHCKLDETHR